MSVSPLSLEFEPLVDLCLGGDALVDVTRFIAKVEHDAILHGLVVLVRMDVRTEGFDRAPLVTLEERRTGEADQCCTWQECLHGVVHLAGLRAVAFIDEHEHVSLGLKSLWKMAVDVG